MKRRPYWCSKHFLVQKISCCHKFAQILAGHVSEYSLILYSYFEKKVVGKNVHATSRKVIWDTINTLFLTLWLLNLLLLLSFSTRKHPWPLVSFFQTPLKNSEFKTTRPFNFGIVACTFSDNHSRNSCIFMAHFQLILLFAVFKHAVKAKRGAGNHALLLF